MKRTNAIDVADNSVKRQKVPPSPAESPSQREAPRPPEVLSTFLWSSSLHMHDGATSNRCRNTYALGSRLHAQIDTFGKVHSGALQFQYFLRPHKDPSPESGSAAASAAGATGTSGSSGGGGLRFTPCSFWDWLESWGRDASVPGTRLIEARPTQTSQAAVEYSGILDLRRECGLVVGLTSRGRSHSFLGRVSPVRPGLGACRATKKAAVEPCGCREVDVEKALRQQKEGG